MLTTNLVAAAMNRALHLDACRDHALVARVVLWDLPAYPERFAARLATSGPSLYLLRAFERSYRLAWRSERQPVDPPEVV